MADPFPLRMRRMAALADGERLSASGAKSVPR